jgi:hypothetical protein
MGYFAGLDVSVKETSVVDRLSRQAKADIGQRLPTNHGDARGGDGGFRQFSLFAQFVTAITGSG